MQLQLPHHDGGDRGLGLQEYLAAAHAASRGEELLAGLAAAFGERWWGR